MGLERLWEKTTSSEVNPEKIKVIRATKTAVFGGRS